MKNETKKLIFSSVCLALAIILPQVFMRNQALGRMLLPMHYPVFICAVFAGARYGALCGFLAPLLCSVIFGMPPFFPTAVAMSIELLSYGILMGCFYKKTNIYLSMISSMLLGRIINGIAQTFFSMFGQNAYTFKIFLNTCFVNSFLGIICIIILIPTFTYILKRIGIDFEKEK